MPAYIQKCATPVTNLNQFNFFVPADALEPFSAAVPSRIDLSESDTYFEDPQFFGLGAVGAPRWPPDPSWIEFSKWPSDPGEVGYFVWAPDLGVVETSKVPPDPGGIEFSKWPPDPGEFRYFVRAPDMGVVETHKWPPDPVGAFEWAPDPGCCLGA